MEKIKKRKTVSGAEEEEENQNQIEEEQEEEGLQMFDEDDGNMEIEKEAGKGKKVTVYCLRIIYLKRKLAERSQRGYLMTISSALETMD